MDAITARCVRQRSKLVIGDKIIENKETEQKSVTKIIDHEGRLRELSDLLKSNSIHIIGVPEDDERERGAEGLFKKIRAENFPNLGKDTDINIQKLSLNQTKVGHCQGISQSHSQNTQTRKES